MLKLLMTSKQSMVVNKASVLMPDMCLPSCCCRTEHRKLAVLVLLPLPAMLILSTAPQK